MAVLTQDSLPDDVAELQRLAMEHSFLIEKLKGQIAIMRRHQFGSKSEDLDQLELMLEEMEIKRSELPAAAEAAPEYKSQPQRKALPDHLPREDVVHTPEADCAACGKSMRVMGEDVREQLDYIPGRFVVIRHVRPKLACRDCGAINQAPMPSLPIERGIPGPGLLAHVMVSKYADDLPLYRQSQIYAREGVDLDTSTMADWIGRSAALLDPLVEAIGRHAMGGDVLFTDDTPVPVLDPGRGKTKTGRLWAYVRDSRAHGADTASAAYYRYSPDRKGERPRDHLSVYSGFLHADGYAGYDKLYGDRIREVACMAHVRRKFFDIAESTASPVATEALERIAALYGIEKEIRGSPPDIRVAARQERSKPLFDDLQSWLGATLPSLPGRSSLATAIRYAITQLKRMTPFFEDGRCELDNNTAERAMRCVAVGRKNYLFASSDRGGERAAAAYTLIETAKLNGIDPQAWLTDVLTRIAERRSIRSTNSRRGSLIQQNGGQDRKVTSMRLRSKGTGHKL